MHPDQPAVEHEGFSFDRQAMGFDRRAGIPGAAAEQIAATALALSTEGIVLDVGAGTGEIGSYLASGPRPYVGLDLSLPMLAVYKRKRGVSPGRFLVRADAATHWPISSASVGLLFLSRAAHLLRPEHLVAEALRLAHPDGAALILGRVRRDPESLRAAMRRQMHRLLAEHSVLGRGGERSRRQLTAAFEQRGAHTAPPRQAASWSITERPTDSLAAWREKPGLAGRAISQEIQIDVLRRLERWARERFDDLETTHQARERYELTVVRLPARGDVATGHL